MEKCDHTNDNTELLKELGLLNDVAKPVLLLTLIDGISENVFVDNDFGLTEWLESHYLILMNNARQDSCQLKDNTCSILKSIHNYP